MTDREQPEPVAWLDDEGFSWVPGELPDEHAKLCKPLYTAPTRKEWQGLTDEEIIQATILIDNRQSGWILDLSRAIEAKLKEKNAL